LQQVLGPAEHFEGSSTVLADNSQQLLLLLGLQLL
jgi:hypothetical protein